MTSTLFLDFASQQKMMALVQDDAILSLETAEGRIDEQDLLPMMERVIGVPLSSSAFPVSRIAAVTGPGGFMSIRTGMSIINTLAWSKHIPLASIHLSDVWGAIALTPMVQTPYRASLSLPASLWLHSTKRELFFIRGFGDFAKDFPEPNVIKFDDLQTLCNAHKTIPFAGEILEDQLTLLPALQKMHDVRSIEDILPSFVQTLTYDQKSLLPWYGRGA
jgi:hypothetical protein